MTEKTILAIVLDKMEKDNHIEKLLSDFIFLDCRLGSHPKVRARVYWGEPGDGLSLPEHTLCAMSGLIEKSELFTQQLAFALRYGSEKVGVVQLDLCYPVRFREEEHRGTVQLLAALLVYIRMRLWRSGIITPTSIALGKALKSVREEVRLTQSELANRINKSRIAVSRWESGAQPPSIGPLYEWCYALGLLSSTSGAHVTVVDVTPRLLKLIQEKPECLRELSPSQFEKFVAGRLDRMGFDVTLTGAATHKDGGIDLIAVPKVRTVGSFLLAGQVKHHRGNQKTGRDAIDRLLAWKDSHFRLGLLVTNTGFTEDAQWVASQMTNQAFIRLRDFEDLKRWIEDNFWSEEDWQEIPDQVNLAPGVTIVIPKPRLLNSLEIWPLSQLDPKDIK